jgi:hypothetical protein
MIPYTDFVLKTNAKAHFDNKNFQLTAEQLLILYFVMDRFHLTDTEMRQVEFLVNRNCRIKTQDRFIQLKYLETVLGALLLVFDRNAKDWKQVNYFIKLICKDEHSVYEMTNSIYGIYRNLYNAFFGIDFSEREYETCTATLKLKR